MRDLVEDVQIGSEVLCVDELREKGEERDKDESDAAKRSKLNKAKAHLLTSESFTFEIL